MTNMMKLNQLTEVGADKLPKFQRLLVKLGLELAEVVEYDGGETYEIWSRPDGSQQTIIKAMEDQIASYNAIVAEIIDCWFELRAIKDLLTGEEVEIAVPEKHQTPYEKFLEIMHNQKAELADAMEVLPQIFGKDPDLELLSFYELDEDTRQALTH